MKPLLAVTMGDPAGIGPEIIVKAMSDKSIFDRAQPIEIFEKIRVISRRT